MAVTYIGEPGRFYAAISVDGATLQPVPGESYDIEDPGDGRWKVAKADKGPVVADTVKTDENGSTDAVEGN
jgi:hypothetical protein